MFLLRSNNFIGTKDQRQRFLDLDDNFEGPSNRKKWIEPYQELVNFRSTNPDRWPQYNREDKKSTESKLYVFCQVMRKRYREEDLGNYWFDKMTSIDFNFEGKVDNWTLYWKKAKDLLKEKESISVYDIGQNMYSWILRNREQYEKGKLSKYQSEKIEELNLDRFFQSWEEKFKNIKEWVAKNGKLPTRKSQKDYNSWLNSQRIRYKNNNLNKEQIGALESIGFILESQRRDDRWFEQFENYKKYIDKYGKDPSSNSSDKGIKSLALWVAAQRMVNAGTARNRKPLSQERKQALDSIDFKWVGEGAMNLTWEDNFNEFKKHLSATGTLDLPSIINGERNPLYTWWYNQKSALKSGKLSDERLKAFEEAGIELNNIDKYSEEYGFTKWANTLYEISAFIEKYGDYPKAGKDRKQGLLYQALARTKRAYRNNKLSEKQIELLQKLNIELD